MIMPTAQWGKPKPEPETCIDCIGLGIFWRQGKPVYCEKCDGWGKVLVKHD